MTTLADLVAEQERRAQASGPLAALQAEADRRGLTPTQRGLGATIYENIIGSGEVDTPGERLGQNINNIAQSFFPGVARGAAELVGLPGTIDEAITGGLERTGIMQPLPDEATVNGNPLSGRNIRGLMGNLTGGATEHRGDSRAERIAGTIGEFTPGATSLGIRGFLGMAAAPGAASEMAGEAAEGTAFEPWARTGAAIATGLLGGGIAGGRAAPIGADDEARRLAEVLRNHDVHPTAGQITGSGPLRNLEGTLSPRPAQIEAFTTAAMRTLGGADTRATASALAAAQTRITGVMDDALNGVSIQPTTAMAQAADDIAARYTEMAPSMALVPRARGIADEIAEAATNPNGPPIDLSTLREWRSTLGRMVGSADEATREAAVSLRGLIDDATDVALQGAGRAEDLARLQEGRVQYRNFLAVRDAATRAGAETGTISPTQLNQSVIRTQGREGYGVGRGTELADLSRAGAGLFRSAPTVEAGGVRHLAPQAGMGGIGAGIGFAATGGSPVGVMAGAAAGSASVPLGHAAMRSRAVQGLLNDPSFLTSALSARLAPGLLASGSAN